MSFIETSALDASNVELAFQNILTGAIDDSHANVTILRLTNSRIQKSTGSYLARRSTAATVLKPPSVLALTSHSARLPTTRLPRVANAAKLLMMMPTT